MKNLMALLLLFPVVVLAASGFAGTWKTRLDSVQVAGKPDVYELSGGIYECKSCVPPFKAKADGTDQPVAPQEYRDHVAVKVLSPSSIEITEKKGGKIMFAQQVSVSADGARLTDTFTSYVGEKPVTGTYTEKRVAPGAQGALSISGSWLQDSVGSMSDVGRMVTLQSSANGLKMMWNGQSTDAKFDGKGYPVVGDPGNTQVTLKRLNDHQIEETDRRHGEVRDVVVWTVAADGKTLTSVDTDPVHGTKTSMVLDRQP